MTYKIALVGIGKIARDQHVPALASSPDFELAATASRNGRVEGIEGFPNLSRLLEARPDITRVSLCTPPHVRYADARATLEAGRHLMMEKPPGATLSEVEDLIALARERNLCIYVSWHSRHAPAVSAARAWLADKHVQSIHISWKEDVRVWHPGQEWIWTAGGLGVLEPGINSLSVLTEIFPRRIHLTSAEMSFPENRETPVSAELTFEDPGGAKITASFDWLETGRQEWDIHIKTLEGKALLSNGGADLIFGDAPVRIDTAEALRGEYPTMYDRFARLMDKGASDADLAPMRHVVDAFALARRTAAPPFVW